MTSAYHREDYLTEGYRFKVSTHYNGLQVHLQKRLMLGFLWKSVGNRYIEPYQYTPDTVGDVVDRYKIGLWRQEDKQIQDREALNGYLGK